MSDSSAEDREVSSAPSSVVVEMAGTASSDRGKQFVQTVLDRVCKGEPVFLALSDLAAAIEEAFPGVLVAFFEADELETHVRRVAHGAMPEMLRDAIERLPIDARGAASGTAAHRKQRVEIADASINPLVTHIRDALASADVRHCVSTPILGDSEELLGVFDVYCTGPLNGIGTAHEATEAVHAAACLAFQLRAREAQVEKLKLQVSEQATEIAGLHNELDAGKSALGHDIRSPLKMLIHQIDQLQEGAKLRNDAVLAGNLSKMHETAHSIDLLLDDLLKIAALTRAELEPEEIDVTYLAKRIADDVKERYHRGDAIVGVQPEMKALADPQMVDVVFDNLLSNACRFTSKSTSATIQVGMNVQNKRRTYFVKDNGAGFHPHTAQRIFEPASRVQVNRDFPGAGLALATVKRLIERHGGRVWCQSGIGQGVSVFFTLGQENDSYQF